MDRKNVIAQREIGDYRITIYRDDCPMCPAVDWDLCGLFIWEYCAHGGMRLSSYSNTQELSCDPHSLEDALKDLVCKYVPQKKIIKYINSSECDDLFFKYDKSGKSWSLYSYDRRTGKTSEWSLLDLEPYEYHGEDCVEEICENLGEDDFKYLLYHYQKDIAFTEWSTSGYCQGDYAEGIAYCDIERYKAMRDADTKNWRKKAVESMEEDAKLIGKWMWGDVYGFDLEKRERFRKVYANPEKEDCDGEEWEDVDCCSGYFNEPDDVIDLVIEEHDISPKSAA